MTAAVIQAMMTTVTVVVIIATSGAVEPVSATTWVMAIMTWECPSAVTLAVIQAIAQATVQAMTTAVIVVMSMI